MSYCWKRFKKNPEPDDVIVHVTYRDNLWLSAESERTRLRYQKNEPEIYDWMYEGVPYDGDGSKKVTAPRDPGRVRARVEGGARAAS